MVKRSQAQKKGNTNSLSVEELCEIPDFLKRKKTPKQNKAKVELTPKQEWQEARKRAHDIAESCRDLTEKSRLETNAKQNEEYHKQKKFYDAVNEHLFTTEAKENHISGNVTPQEKKQYNIYIKTGITPEDMAKYVLKWRLLESGKRS